MLDNQYLLELHRELIVDLFSGGGGMSTAIEQAVGRYVDIACNHDKYALALHQVNHPQTTHKRAGVFELDPIAIAARRFVGLLHLSPDCTDHSQAKGGQPRDKKIRALAWVAVRWCGTVAPFLVTLENVCEIQRWGPLVAKRDPATGRVVKLDGTVAEPGERIRVQDQYLVPDKKRLGQTWRRFKSILRSMSYVLEHREMLAADWGAGTTRNRLFMVARRDGFPIVWPNPTHFQFPQPGQKAWTPAADGLDFSLLSHSIYMPPRAAKLLRIKRPLADKTLTRLAHGTVRHTLTHADPFIIPATHAGTGDRSRSVREPLPTITGAHRGELMLGQPVLTPLRGGIALGRIEAFGQNARGSDLRDPMQRIVPGATRYTEVECNAERFQGLTTEEKAGAVRVARFLLRYAGPGALGARVTKPVSKLTREDLLAMVTVTVKGAAYVITDIGMRMLTPRELANCQGLPRNYILDRDINGNPFSKGTQISMIGNSVSPPPAHALIAANYRPHLFYQKAA